MEQRKYQIQKQNIKKDLLEKIIGISYILMISIILGVCLFENNIDYAGKIYIICAEPILLFGGILFISILVVTLYWMWSHVLKNKNLGNKALLFFSILLLLFQSYCVWNYFFTTGWDVWTIMAASEAVAHGGSLQDYQEYFSVYPNNLLLVWLYGTLIRFFDLVKINFRIGILFFQCVLSWGTGLILFGCVEKILKSRHAAWFAWILYLILVGMSPWVSIPYSDSIGLIFPIFILWLYIRAREENTNKKCLYVGIIGLLTMIGYRIKPQIVIVVIAICIISLVYMLRDLKQILKMFISMSAGLLIAMILVSTCIQSLNMEVNSNRTYGITHFLMMGMNYSEVNGVWNLEDVEFSGSFDTLKERKKANLQVTKERIKEMGIPGIVHLMRRKILTNYNDGTFCWGGEGSFFWEILSKKNSCFAQFLRNIYYTNNWDRGYYKWFSNFELMVWIAILFLGILSVFQNKKELSVIMLAVIGLTVFELLFEPRARYLYTYAPFYIILAVSGIQMIIKRNQYYYQWKEKL